MKGRKLFITLLVVVIAMGLLLSVVACKPPQTPPNNNNNNNNDDDDDDEFDLATMLGVGVNTVVDVVDETVRQALAIDDAAHIGATLFLAVSYTGTEESPVPPINLDLEIKVEASFDAQTETKNAVLLEVTDKTDGGLGLIASIFAANVAGSEYVYIGQKAWNSTFTWVKMSQADKAGILASFVANKVADVVLDLARMDMSKKDKNGNVTQELTLGDRAEDGLISGLVGDFLGFVPLIAPLEIIMPTTVEGEGVTKVTEAGFGVTAATATFPETKVAGGAELKIMVENLGEIVGIAGVLGIDFAGLKTSLTSSGMFGLVDILVGAILGQSFDELFIDEQEEGAEANVVYPKQIAIGVGHNGTVLTGIGLHYDYTNDTELPLKLDLGIKNLVVSNQSVTTVKPSDLNYATAPEAAVELSLDVILANEAVNSTVKVYAYPTISIDLVEGTKVVGEETITTPFINLNLTGIQGFATITDNKFPQNPAAYIADFQAGNAEGQNGFKLDLGPIIAALGNDMAVEFEGVEQQYFIPLDAQAMWNDYFGGMTEGYTLPDNASVIDGIAAELEGGFSIGSILSLLNFVDPIVAELEALVKEGGPISFGFFEREDEEEPADRAAFATIDLASLMTDLVDGILGDTETITFKAYYDNTTGAVLDTPVEADLAYYLATNNVIDSVVTLMNYNFGVSAANDAWIVAQGENPWNDEDMKAARDAYFDDDPETVTTWALAPIDAQEDLFTQADAIRIFKAVTGKDLSAADAYAGLTLDMFASLGASSKTDAEGITLSIALLDDTQGTLVKVALNLNIKAEDTAALTAYEKSGFQTMWEEGAYANTSSDDGEGLFTLLTDLVMAFAQVEELE